jgi:large subunit ribosomal protein L15
MAISLSNLKPASGARSKFKRVGRGNASGKGTTAGRGTKGQRARTGGRNKLKLLGLRRLVMATPKLRGFQRQRRPSAAVNVGDLEAAFVTGSTVTPKALAKKGLVPTGASRVKILAGGSLKKKLKVTGCVVTGAAKEKITAAQGEVA